MAAIAVYGETPVRDFLRAQAERHVSDGLAYQELVRAERELDTWDRWVPWWLERAAALEAAADAAATEVTTASLLVQASLAAHVAQYLHFREPEVWSKALERKVDLYRRAAPLLSPPAEAVEVPFGSASLPAYLRVPAGAGPVACVIYAGGLDAHKEDAHAFAELCVARGMAVLAYDGPGQGEARARGLVLGADAHEAVSALIDFLDGDERIDSGRIGLVGRSLGGYLGPRAAADDPRIGALAVWGAMYDLRVFRDLPPHTRAACVHVTGTADEDAANAHLAFVDLAGQATRIKCPTLVVHGENDVLTPPDHAQRLVDDIGDTARLELVPGSPHCNHDRAHLLRPLMADWLQETLR